MLDLAAWASEKYRIPGEPIPQYAEAGHDDEQD